MPYLFVRHKTEDYAKWKSTFNEFAPIRRAGREKTYAICHVAGDPNDIVVLNEWDSAEDLQKFLQSQDLKEGMQRAGVSEQPEIYIFELIEKGSV